jgi:hypothetical protein
MDDKRSRGLEILPLIGAAIPGMRSPESGTVQFPIPLAAPCR